MEILFQDKDILVCVKPVGLDSEKELPEALQQLLAQLQMAGTASMPQSSQSESSSFQFLKQLVQFFMPRPAEEEGAQPYTQQQPQQENAPDDHGKSRE